jgi:hypothetical protein
MRDAFKTVALIAGVIFAAGMVGVANAGCLTCSTRGAEYGIPVIASSLLFIGAAWVFPSKRQILFLVAATLVVVGLVAGFLLLGNPNE